MSSSRDSIKKESLKCACASSEEDPDSSPSPGFTLTPRVSTRDNPYWKGHKLWKCACPIGCSQNNQSRIRSLSTLCADTHLRMGVYTMIKSANHPGSTMQINESENGAKWVLCKSIDKLAARFSEKYEKFGFHVKYDKKTLEEEEDDDDVDEKGLDESQKTSHKPTEED
ncbi:uncharacterized protein IL334_005186 [Kwoniella shivajii]|uniref:RanBD1 domain-containing protein n=1 Tax=Kwoniella shivajii TaxID=564305 RepID=A0ABZ1D5F8_9TREE|nr:hypothetical protein IL334_005186 [Kwoniella shivajii]